MNIGNISALQSSIKNTIQLYNNWKSKEGNEDADFVTFLQLSTKGPNALAEDWEAILEDGGDGIDGNTISFERYYQEDGCLYFQTDDNKVIKIDSSKNNGAIEVLDETEFAEQFGVEDEYDIMDFGLDDFDIIEYSFTGLGDGSADAFQSDENHYTYQELDVTSTNGQKAVSSMVDSYVSSQGSIDSLKDVFGNEEGANANVTYSSNGQSMAIIQNGKLMIGTYTSEKGLTFTEVTSSNISDYFPGLILNTQKTVSDINYTIDSQGRIQAQVVYSDDTTSSTFVNSDFGDS